MPNFIDLTNKRFARFLVLRRDFTNVRTAWICQCDCGVVKSIRSNHLIRGDSKSCGCLHSELSSARTDKLHKSNTKTGLSGSSTYQSWCGMKQRCHNPKNKFFSYYGGRGIKVCDRWIYSFENFLVDMGQCLKGMTIDRIDGSKDYEPGNCRWATRKQQQNNLRSNRLYEIYGKTLTLSQIAETFGIHRNTLDQRLAKGMPIEKAVIPPK